MGLVPEIWGIPMSRFISRIRSLIRPRPRRQTSGGLSRAQAAVLRRNLRALLLSKESLTESR